MDMILSQSQSANVLKEITLFTVSPNGITKKSQLGVESGRRESRIGKKRDEEVELQKCKMWKLIVNLENYSH